MGQRPYIYLWNAIFAIFAIFFAIFFGALRYFLGRCDIFWGIAIFFHVERYFLSKVDTKRFAFFFAVFSNFSFLWTYYKTKWTVRNIILMEKPSFCGPTFKEIRVWTKQNSEISRSVSYMYFCIFNRFVVNGSKIMFQCTSDDRWDHSLYFANTLSMFPILPVPSNSFSDVIKSNSDRPDKSGKFHPNGAHEFFTAKKWTLNGTSVRF